MRYPFPTPSPTAIYTSPGWEVVTLSAAATVLTFVLGLWFLYIRRKRRERQFAERVARYLRDKV